MNLLRRNNEEPLDLGSSFWIFLAQLSANEALFTIEQFFASLNATTTLAVLKVNFCGFESTPENNRRVIEPLCRCIANLRRHNQNHTLRKLTIFNANNKDPDCKPFLVAAKQFGIHCLEFLQTILPIDSLVEFCRDNNHLKVLRIFNLTLLDEASTISVSPQDGPQDSSAILALDKLLLDEVRFENSTVATKFSDFIAHVTYPALDLKTIGGHGSSEEEAKISRMRILSALIKPSVQQLVLNAGCPIEVMDVIEACATVAQIRVSDHSPPIDFRPAAMQQKLQAIATRNRELADFVANPRDYPGSDLLALMRQFDSSPTGRYMLARCFPGIPSFFVIKKSTDSSTAGLKKKY